MPHAITRRALLSGLAIAATAAALAPAIASPVAYDGWQFQVGDWVTHKDQPLPSLVMGRVRTSKGREVYGLRSFAIMDPNRDRMILGESLKPIDDEARAICLAHTSGLA